MSAEFDPTIHVKKAQSEVTQLRGILQHLNQRMQQDQLVQDTADQLRTFLRVDRVVLYYFYSEWEGQVTFESLSSSKFSIYGSTGPDQCFNDEYAALYLEGRVRAIEDVETAAIEACHRDFLRCLDVRANLVVPILTERGLWGLLVAHHCQGPKSWSEAEIDRMQAGAAVLANASSIKAD
ncbi:MAG: GAF domain-containing protein [Cyanobacteria bacterium J06554_6]